MKSPNFCLVVIFLLSGCLAASAPARADYIDSLELGIDAGYRVDQLDWNIASDLTGTVTPNIISELTWDDLEIYQVGGSGKLAVGNHYVNFLTYLRGRVDYGWIVDGTNQDSDYAGNDRTQEFSRSIATTKDDNVFDASIGLGFQWKFWQNRFSIAPLGGYSYHEQNLRVTQGVQTVDPYNLVGLGPFSGLDSTFKSSWQGPWAGVDIEASPSSRFSFQGTFEYHWADYEAKADWNLRSDLAHPVSFRHEASDATGYLASIGGKYRWSPHFAVQVQFAYQEWKTDPGIIRFYGADGTTSDQRLNEVNWKSSSASLGGTYSF